MDDRDAAILAALRRDGRAPLKVLAAAAGLSTSATQERLARLERDGTIAGYTVLLGESERAAHAYMIVATHARQCAEVAPRLAEIPEIVVADSVAGEQDLVLVVVAPTPARLQAIRDEIAALPAVRSVLTLPRLVRRFARPVVRDDLA